MQVSAITAQNNNYNGLNKIGNYSSRVGDSKQDTSFNSSYNNRKSVQTDTMPIVFDSVNQWKNFCHQRVLGGKLNIIA